MLVSNVVLIVEYDGSEFYGFQIQPDVPTVQGEIEKALFNFTSKMHKIYCAGRTDTGVHALHQVVNFTTTINRPIANWISGLNTYLPSSIVVKHAYYAELEFNACKSATSRTYQYYLYVGKSRPAIFYKYLGWCAHELNVELVLNAMQALLGTHDFASFQASGCVASSSIKTMIAASLTTNTNQFAIALPEKVSGHVICFTFQANSFLYHMIRNLVGALVYVGLERLSVDRFRTLMKDGGRHAMPPTYSANGLYLIGATY